MPRISLEELKKEYTGQTFNWLTVLDVYRNENSILYFKCKCKCGNIVDVRKQYVLSNHTTSCGCYKCSHEKGAKYTNWYKNNPDKVKIMHEHYHQTINDNPEILKERGRKQSELYKNNPEIINKISESNKKYWKDNPDKLAERGKHRSEWSKNNPEAQLQINQKLIDYYNNNPDARKLIGSKLSELYNCDYYKNLFSNIHTDWCKNNQDKLIEIGINRSELYKNNPDIINRISKSSKEYWKNNTDKALQRGTKCSEWCKNNRQAKLKLNANLSEFYKVKRINFNFIDLLEIIHPDNTTQLLNGDIKSSDTVLTKCPNCGNFDKHTLSNIYHITANKFKLGHAPLCEKCRNNLITSSYEKEIEDYIRSFYNGEAIRNTRNIISPLELDIYIPEKKIAIEFNGDYFHSEQMGKSNNYHHNKYLKCKDNNILLISIFESEWNNRKDEIKEYIKDTFNGKENKLSFNEDHTLMNNNYPSINHYLTTNSYIENIYYNSTYKIFTCGYSKL